MSNVFFILVWSQVGIDFGGEALIDNLRKFARYAVIVQAFNSKGTGPPSYPVIGTTLQDGNKQTRIIISNKCL